MKLRIVLFLLSVVFFQGCATTKTTSTFEEGVIPEFVPSNVAKSEESKALLGQFSEKEGVEIVEEGAQYERLERLIKGLVEPLGVMVEEIPTYVMLDDDKPNAFALNSHSIIATTGLMNKTTDEELSVVIAHEIAHILKMHSDDDTERKRQSGVNAGASILGAIVAIATGIDVVGDVVAQGSYAIGMGAFVLSYSRAQELEADHIGILILANAGYDPNNAVKFWRNSDEILGVGSKTSFLSTHPSHGSRQERLEEALVYAIPLYDAAKANGLPMHTPTYTPLDTLVEGPL